MHLVIKNIDDSDGGEYYCHAENGFGNATQAVSVRLRNVVSAFTVHFNFLLHSTEKGFA